MEVVQGRTPFLVSNAVMRELGVLIDPRNQVLRFLKGPRTIPLKTCRKNLLCVDVTALLDITHEETAGKHTEEIYQHEDKREDEQKQKSNIPPRTCMSTQLEVIVQHPPHRESLKTTESEQTQAQAELPSTPPSCDPSRQSHGHIEGDSELLPGAGSVRRRGPGPSVQSDVHGRPRSSISSSPRDQELTAVGRDQGSLGQAAGSDLFGGVRQSPLLHLPDPQPQSGITMVEEPAELRDCPPEVPDETSGANSTDTGGIPKHVPDINTEEIHGSKRERGTRVGSDRQDSSPVIECQEAPVRQEINNGTGITRPGQDDRGTQCRTSAANQDSDCPPRKRTGSRDADSGRGRHLKQDPVLLSEAQVQGLQAQVDQFVGVIEKDFAKIRQNAEVLNPPKPTNQSRPVVLLEIYCEQESQLTQQMKRMGGTALRFTRLHGDRSTPEGVNMGDDV